MSSLIERIKEQARIVSEKSGINAAILYAGLIGIIVALVLEKLDGQLVTLTVGVVLPAIFSLKALKSEDKGDDKQWLTYWTVFGLFVVLELFFLSHLIGHKYYYFLGKLVFLIWLFLPNFQGAAVIYDKFIFKVFKSAEKDIDNMVNKVTSRKTA